MKLSNRSYPHPVLGNADDVPGAAFQATFEYASDLQFYYITVSIACSSKSLNRLIASGGACHVLHIECSNTMFRQAFEFEQSTHRFQIPANLLNGTVEVNAFIRSKKEFESYRVEGSHADYDGTTFFVKVGDVLAVGEGQLFEAETTHDSLKRVGSIMIIERSSHEGDHLMTVDLGSEKIRILLCKGDFDAYGKLKLIPALTSHLTTTIVLPVLIEALHAIEDGRQGYDHLKWHKNLQRRIEILGLGTDLDALTKAQRILDMPIRRALGAAESYAVGANA